MPECRVGTSGWAYKHWRGPFYPEELSSTQWLRFCAERYSSIEINNSFYHLPTEQTFRKWHDEVPDDFLFSVKASRYITHMKKLKEPENSLPPLMERVELLAEKLGPILFQLPPSWSLNLERLNEFLDALPPKRLHTFEFRNPSWFVEDVFRALREHNAALCIYELAGQNSPRELTADFVYIRLHGPDGAYGGNYPHETLKEWADAISGWRRSRKGVYCYFDNDQNGYAALNAADLWNMVKG